MRAAVRVRMEEKMAVNTIVIGHKNPDTDSICSAIGYANLKSKVKGETYEAKRAGNVSDETKYALNKFNVEEPEYVENVAGKKVILVDHNEVAQAADGIEEAEIVEIIDHHKIGTIQTAAPIYFRNQPVGCSATIIYQMYKENGVEIDKNIAGLLCSAILSDTLIFKSPTCTDADVAACKDLASIAGVEAESYGLDMLKAGSNISAKTAEEVFYQDFKKFEIAGKVIGVGQVNAMGADDVKEVKAKVADYIKTVLSKDGLDMTFLMVTDILAASSDVMCEGENAAKVLADAFGVEVKDNSAYLEGVVSRKKQVIPSITKALQ